MQGLLDAYGKFHRFTIANGRLCFAARMMDTDFWNSSTAARKVAPDALFMETVPPRGYGVLENLKGKGDNTFVNTLRFGDSYLSVTDSQKMLRFDPISLRITGNHTWDDKMDFLNMALGSAHPLPDPQSDAGCMLGLHPQRNLPPLGSEVQVYRFCPDAPSKRVPVAKYNTDYMAYFHSFGISAGVNKGSAGHAVLPLMHFEVRGVRGRQPGMRGSWQRGATPLHPLHPRGSGVPRRLGACRVPSPPHRASPHRTEGHPMQSKPHPTFPTAPSPTPSHRRPPNAIEAPPNLTPPARST